MGKIGLCRGTIRVPCASRRLAVVLLCAMLAALIPAATQAQSAGPDVSLSALAIPPSVFGRSARVTKRSVSDAAAATASRLHTRPFSELGRTEGLLQTATWRPATAQRLHESVLSIQYLGSVFPSEAAAAAAYGDAEATLWEVGSPTAIPGMDALAFTVKESHREEIHVVFHHSVVQGELRLRTGSATSSAGLKDGIKVLRRAVASATRLAADATASLPVPIASYGEELPPIFAAPVGTGPIVKSPSLLTMPDTGAGVVQPGDPGAFRAAAPPPIGTGAKRVAYLVPSGALARFVRIARDAVSHIEWYDSAVLYPTPAAAADALRSLAAANAGLHGLRPVAAPTLPTVDSAAMWHRGNETFLAFQTGNLLTVLAGTTADVAPSAAAARTIIALVPTWLHTSGTSILDSLGEPVHLAALNWYGAEQQDFVVGGLDYQPYQSILQTVRSLGYNTIRLPFSDQLVQQNPIVTAHVAANPALSGLHALDILDRIIGYAGAVGLHVILDNHRSEAGWSSQESGLWYTDTYTDATFNVDWSTMARRYAASNVVIGADLRNEPHGAATWGDGNPATDWHLAAERAGATVLAANPHLLVIVEGVQYYGSAQSGWWGGNLMGVATAPVVLRYPDGTTATDRLVYSAHDYGPDMCGGGCPWFSSTTTYASLSAVWDQYWGYITADPAKPYAAPLWIGEFGTCNYRKECVMDTTPGSQGQWFSSLVRYLAERHLSWSYWSINGTQSTGGQRVYGALDWYGLLRQDWTGPVPWVHDALVPILGNTAPIPGSPGSAPPG